MKILTKLMCLLSDISKNFSLQCYENTENRFKTSYNVHVCVCVHVYVCVCVYMCMQSVCVCVHTRSLWRHDYDHPAPPPLSSEQISCHCFFSHHYPS